MTEVYEYDFYSNNNICHRSSAIDLAYMFDYI